MNKISILKLNEDKKQAFGWASIAVRVDGKPLVDLQNDTIDTETLENAAYHYTANFGIAGEMHHEKKKAVGKLIESVVFTLEKAEAMGIPQGYLPQGGWWVGFQVLDDEVWEKVKSGEYNMFSIEGTAQRVELPEQNNNPENQTA